ncbi:MAG TPA: patatin-like phospholipase family protein [Nocardioidaceae bacterium]|nr:patatin-like phospholipase family protein [Nocardioidaceae bacterium]
MDEPRVALVLDAGGARSAYQVGALEVLLPALAERGARPRLLIGTSAGALLSAALTASAHRDAAEQAARLVEVLGQATKGNVIRPLWRQVPEVVARYASETLGLSFFRLRGLFGTQPLARTLERSIDWDDLHRNVDEGLVEATAVTATSVRTGQVVLFTESGAAVPAAASRYHRRFVATRLNVSHLLASSAIPALFPSVSVDEPADAAGWYVDGATRRRVPLAPALELGADHVVAVGTGGLRPPDTDPGRDAVAVDLADGGATLLGAVMDDPLRHDLARLAEINAMAQDDELAPVLARHRERAGLSAYRTVPYVAVAPQDGEELARTAMEVFRANHGSLRRTIGDPDLQVMHRLLGSDSPLQGEMLSYLLFDPDFFAAASDLGRRDAKRWVEDHPDLWRTGPLPRA